MGGDEGSSSSAASKRGAGGAGLRGARGAAVVGSGWLTAAPPRARSSPGLPC